MYIKIDGTNTESLPCRGSTLEKFTAKINRIKIVNGMDKFHWFWDFEDLIEKSNNLLNDNPEIINASPYDEGWFFKIKPQDIEELANLLDSEAYKKVSES